MNKHLLQLRWIALAFVAACQSGQSSDHASQPPAPVDPPSAPLAVGPERQVDLANHAVLAFRPTPGGFAGGYTTHHALVRDGIVELTPYSFERGERRARTSMTLETTAITMDDAMIGGLTGTRLEDGAVILERDQDQIIERLRNDADGLRQEWQFNAAPALSGDLVVEVSVLGHTYTTTTDSGVHFASKDGPGFRYSHAVWVGGDGTEWPIAAVHDNGRIRMTIPEGVVAATVFPAVLDPTITGEVAVDAPVVGSTGTNSLNPSIAFNGTNYLVVWEDQRNSNDNDIWGTRLDATGAVLDPLGIQIGAAAGKQLNPTVAYNGSTFVVAWEDFKVAGGTEADIAVAAVSNAGLVTPIAAVAATTASETQPALAGGGGTALLTWNSAGDIRGSINTDLVFGASFAVAATTAIEVEPAVAVDPAAAGNFLVLWTEGPAATADLRGQLVTKAGALSGAAFDVSRGGGIQSAATAAFDGTNFAAAWTNNAGGVNIFGARISTAGAVLDTHLEGTVTVGGVSITSALNNQEVSSIACVAAGCTVLWQERRNLATTGFDIYGQVLTPAFTPSGPEIIVSNAGRSQLTPVLVANGTDHFSVWIDNRDGETNTVFGGQLTVAGVPGTAHPVVSGNNRETQPGLGFAGGIFGLFWSDSVVYGNDIRFVRFNVNGSKLDATPRVASAAVNAQLSPSASTDLGTSSLVVWADTRNGAGKDIFGGRITMSTGAALDGDGFAITTAANDQLLPSVASNGTVALVTWQDRRSNATFDIFGALVTSAGAVMVPDIVICNDTVGNQGRPIVTWNAASSQFLVVWSDDRSGTSHIFGARVSPTGEVLDPNGVAITNGAVGQFGASIASDAAGSFVVWEDRKLGQDIFGSRLAGGMTLGVLDPNGIAISTAAGGQSAPRIASLGSSYAVVWVDSRNTQTDIFGQQISTAGVLSEGEFPVSNTPDDEFNPTILKGVGNNVARVAYESRRFNTSRVGTRVITTQTAGGATCTSATQCSTGFCVDGRCCNSECGGNNSTDCQGCSFARTNQPDGLCAPLPSTTTCRGYASSFCDLREFCDGLTSVCPVDVGRNQGLVCNKTSNFPPGTGTGICPTNGAPGPHPCQ